MMELKLKRVAKVSRYESSQKAKAHREEAANFIKNAAELFDSGNAAERDTAKMYVLLGIGNALVALAFEPKYPDSGP